MSKSNIVVIIIVGIIIFVIGGAVGVFYQMQKDAPELLKASALEKLSSNVIPSIVAYGEVLDINGRDVLISFSGASLTVPIDENAQVYSFNNSSASESPTQQQANFSEIKKGDYLNISLKVSMDGEIQGKTVIILPPASGSNN